MGGTNIDGVIIRNGSLHKAVKHQVNHDDVLHSILACLQDLLRDVDEGNLERINLSTTVCTNAIVEDKVSQVGLILQQGPGLQWQFDRMGDYLRYLSGRVLAVRMSSVSTTPALSMPGIIFHDDGTSRRQAYSHAEGKEQGRGHHRFAFG